MTIPCLSIALLKHAIPLLCFTLLSLSSTFHHCAFPWLALP
nr:MAG TPA: hypothetical protein [Caudoviricetes sp.]